MRSFTAFVLIASAAALRTGPSLARRELVVSTTAALVAAAPATPSNAAVASISYTEQPGLKLNTGVNFPIASFGLQVYDDATAEELTLIALELGYRNFFASVLARNQRGFARAVKRSGVPRTDMFICGSVLSNRAQGYEAAYRKSKRECDDNLEAFAVGGIDYVDMIMLDYPGPDDNSIRGQWKALEDMAGAKQARGLAVSNFSPRQLDAIIKSGGTVPTCNQLPYGVGFSEYYAGRGGASFVVEENSKRGVVVQAWSPLGRALRGRNREVCAEIGAKYQKSAAQVGLKWIAATGCTFTTQSKNRNHFKEDLELFDFELTPKEVALLSTL